MALILIVDDEKNMRRVLAANLARDGHETMEAASGRDALVECAGQTPDCVLTDLKMPDMDGMDLLAHLNAQDPHLPVVMLTAHGTVQTAVEAMKRGAFDYLTKPFDTDELLQTVRRAVETRRLDDREPAESVDTADLTANEAMRKLYALADKVADSPTTVLITGESGTGKEVLARRLHEKSGRVDKPYIRVNCAAIPSGLVESELFGHEKGAFTGAVGSKPGRFELADGGTLFLDEIGAVPLETQVKLLRALQERQFERVGGIKTINVDVRLIAATNVDLKHEASEGRFREDLYYRLNVVHLRLPALRERMEDLPLLLETFRKRFNERLGRNVVQFNAEALATMRAYSWPGNIRELENAVERAVLLCDGDTVTVHELPDEMHARPGSAPVATGPDAPLGDIKEASREAAARVEVDMIRRALKETGGNVTQAARILGLSRKGLQIKMREHDLERDSGD